jgi:hypothetical protein
MASNFNMFVHRNSDTLHLKLAGNFDGSSACELLNLIKEKSNGVSKVIIHTNCLAEIHPFGRDTFQRNLISMNGHPFRMLFTGEKATQLAPDKSSCI